MSENLTHYSIADARDRFTELVHEAEQGNPVALTRRGQPVAVILSMRAYQRLSGGGADFWQALGQFRKEHDMHQLEVSDAIFTQTRDRSLGREVDL
jgi:prevent-host-death family protein